MPSSAYSSPGQALLSSNASLFQFDFQTSVNLLSLIGIKKVNLEVP